MNFTKEDVTARPICPGCKCEHDPDWCHCGDAREQHHIYTGHGFVPMGCQCGRDAPLLNPEGDMMDDEHG